MARPRTPATLRHDEIALQMIREAAEAGRAAPSDKEISIALGHRSMASGHSATVRLARAGLINVVRTAPNARVIEIVGAGICTADIRPKSVSPTAGRRGGRPPSEARLGRNSKRVMQAIRELAAPGRGVSGPKIAQTAGLPQRVVFRSLAALRYHGFIVSRAGAVDGGATAWLPADMANAEGTRVEVRDGVKVTICPTRWAAGAYSSRSSTLSL